MNTVLKEKHAQLVLDAVVDLITAAQESDREAQLERARKDPRLKKLATLSKQITKLEGEKRVLFNQFEKSIKDMAYIDQEAGTLSAKGKFYINKAELAQIKIDIIERIHLGHYKNTDALITDLVKDHA